MQSNKSLGRLNDEKPRSRSRRASGSFLPQSNSDIANKSIRWSKLCPKEGYNDNRKAFIWGEFLGAGVDKGKTVEATQTTKNSRKENCPAAAEHDPNPFAISESSGLGLVDLACGQDIATMLTYKGRLYTLSLEHQPVNTVSRDATTRQANNTPIPMLLDSLQHFRITAIACGSNHCAAISSCGSVISWGRACAALGHGKR